MLHWSNSKWIVSKGFFFLSRMATVSKDGTWKIWDIDGEFFILKLIFGLLLNFLLTFEVHYVPLHLDPSVILYFRLNT